MVSFWATPQFKMIIPNQNETTEKGAREHKGNRLGGTKLLGILTLGLGDPVQIRGEPGEWYTIRLA